LEDENVRIRYLGTTVPRNWIPFIPDGLHLLDLPGANHIGRDARGRERRAVN
jgi:hypothetical protein